METGLEDTQDKIESSVVDIVFDIEGKAIPEDNSSALWREVLRHLPWLEQEKHAGIHPLQAAPSDYGMLLLTRRTKLVLRVAQAHVAAAMELTGRQLDIGDNVLRVGSGKVRPLPVFGTIYAHFVDMGSADETQFARHLARRLEEMKIQTKFICGKRQALHTDQGVVSGFSLMLYDLTPAQSILLQEIGLGANRQLGCGIFIPHKSIAAIMA